MGLSFQVSGWDIRFIYFKGNFLAVGWKHWWDDHELEFGDRMMIEC